MAYYEIDLSKMKLSYAITKIDTFFFDVSVFDLRLRKNTVEVRYFDYNPLVVVEFLDNKSAELFYVWLSNKPFKEQFSVLLDMVAKYYEKEYVEPARNRLKRLKGDINEQSKQVKE